MVGGVGEVVVEEHERGKERGGIEAEERAAVVF